MRTDFPLWMATLLVAVAATSAGAATIQAIPASTEVAAGSQLEVLISGSGFPDGTDGGDFSLSWDSTVLAYEGTTIIDPPWDIYFVDDHQAVGGNLLDFVDVFSSSETPGFGGAAFDIARITFSVIGQPGESSILDLSIFTVGWSLAGESVPTEYVSAEVFVAVPEPVTGWLFALGLAGMAGIRRLR